MRAEKFNKLTLDQKFVFIKKRLGNQPAGFCNQTIFKDKIVFSLFGRNGQPGICNAEDLPKKFKKITAEILNKKNLVCLNRICDEEDAYKQKVFEVTFENSSLKN